MVQLGKCRRCGLVLLVPRERCPACDGDSITPIESRRRSPVGPESAQYGRPGPEDGPAEAAPPGGPIGRGRAAGEATDGDFDGRGASRPTQWEIVYHCPDEFVALTLQSELERHGIHSWIRSLELPGYEGLIRTRPVWGWLLVDTEDLEESLVILRSFLEAVEREDR